MLHSNTDLNFSLLVFVYINFINNNKFLKFSISDQGPGFTAEDQEVIFTQFADLSAKPTGGEGSTGIGLSIAKAIISLHNGKIWAENNQNIGSTIHFTIPV